MEQHTTKYGEIEVLKDSMLTTIYICRFAVCIRKHLVIYSRGSTGGPCKNKKMVMVVVTQ